MRVIVKKSVIVTLELTSHETTLLIEALQKAITAHQDGMFHIPDTSLEWYRELWNKCDNALEHENYEEEII